MMTETNSLHKPPRMRGIKQAIDELQQLDANTALTEHALRKLVVSNTIPSVRCGSKYLINMNVLENYLYDGSCDKEIDSVNSFRSIRKGKKR